MKGMEPRRSWQRLPRRQLDLRVWVPVAQAPCAVPRCFAPAGLCPQARVGAFAACPGWHCDQHGHIMWS